MGTERGDESLPTDSGLGVPGGSFPTEKDEDEEYTDANTANAVWNSLLDCTEKRSPELIHSLHSTDDIPCNRGISNTQSTESIFHYRYPIDHGWAWVIAFGGFLSNVFFAGIVRSTGLLFVEYCTLYKTNNAEASWIISVQYITFYFSSPLSSLFETRFSGRAAAYMAGFLSMLGFMISSFSPSINVIYFSHGVLMGLTLSFLCSPIITTVSLYFRKRSSLAIGITLMGASVGTFIIPPLVQVIMDEYGFRNMLMIMSAIFSHIFIIGALLRPVSVYGTPKICAKHLITAIEVEIAENLAENETIVVKEEEASGIKPASTTGELFHKMCPQWNHQIIREQRLYVFIASFALAHLGLILSFFMIPPHATDLGLDDKDRTLILFVMGFPDLVCRILTGYIADRPEVNELFFFSAVVLAQAAVWFIASFTSNFVGLTIFALFVSGLGGIIWTLIPIILKSTFGLRNLGTTMGFTLLFAGFVFLAIPPLLGYIRDMTGSWIWSFRFVSIMMTLAGLLVLLEPLIKRIDFRKKENTSTEGPTEEAEQ